MWIPDLLLPTYMSMNKSLNHHMAFRTTRCTLNRLVSLSTSISMNYLFLEIFKYNSLKYLFYLFERQCQRRSRSRKRSSDCCFIPQMAPKPKTGPGRNQETGISFWSPTWVASDLLLFRYISWKPIQKPHSLDIELHSNEHSLDIELHSPVCKWGLNQLCSNANPNCINCQHLIYIFRNKWAF